MCKQGLSLLSYSCLCYCMASWICSSTRSSGLSCILSLIGFCYTEISIDFMGTALSYLCIGCPCYCSRNIFSSTLVHFSLLLQPIFARPACHDGALAALLLLFCTAGQKIWTLGGSGAAWTGPSCAKTKDHQSSACNLTVISTNQCKNFD